MTIEEACALLDISPDEDLDLNLLEINYDKKIAGLEPASLDRERIDEACKYLLNIYDELSTSEQDTQKSNSFLNRTTFSIAAIITICLILFFALSKTNDVQYPVQHPVSSFLSDIDPDRLMQGCRARAIEKEKEDIRKQNIKKMKQLQKAAESEEEHNETGQNIN